MLQFEVQEQKAATFPRRDLGRDTLVSPRTVICARADWLTSVLSGHTASLERRRWNTQQRRTWRTWTREKRRVRDFCTSAPPCHCLTVSRVDHVSPEVASAFFLSRFFPSSRLCVALDKGTTGVHSQVTRSSQTQWEQARGIRMRKK